MIRLSLFMSLLLTSIAVLADIQTNIGGGIYIPPYTINNGQNIVVNFGNINPEHMDNSRGEVAKTVSISCPYKSGSLWIKVTGNTMEGGQNDIPAANMTHFGIASYQGRGMSTPLTLGNGSGNDYRVTAGLDTARSAFIFTSVPFHNDSGILNGGNFRTTANTSMTYNWVMPKWITVITEVIPDEKIVPCFFIFIPVGL